MLLIIKRPSSHKTIAAGITSKMFYQQVISKNMADYSTFDFLPTSLKRTRSLFKCKQRYLDITE